MRTTRQPGFTLIELLVVIVLVTLLVSIISAVGSGVLSGGKGRQTRDSIRVVDSAIDTYFNTVGTAPPAFVVAYRPDGPEVEDPSFTFESYSAYPLADAVDLTDGVEENRTRINSIGLFIRAMELQGLGDFFSGVSSELLTRWDGDADLADASGEFVTDTGRQPELRTIVDGWGKPLRFVHPAWDGEVTEENNRGDARDAGDPGTSVAPLADESPDDDTDFWLDLSRAPLAFDQADQDQFPIRQIRRNFISAADRAEQGNLIGDGDGGYTVGGRPYAYSAGEDGDPSRLDDNVYTSVPRFTAE